MEKKILLENLFATETIRLRRGPIFDSRPEPMPAKFDFDRVEGMMMGLAVGDSLGNTSESLIPRQRRERHGEIRDYLPHRWAEGRAVGLPSDDTQLAFRTLQDILEHGEFRPDSVAARFANDRIFGIGRSVREFTFNYQLGKPWYEAGPRSAGNGALMRIAPILIPHLKTADENLWSDAALCALITHNDSASLASCVAFVKVLWELIRMESPPEPEWWLATFTDVLEELEMDFEYTPRMGDFDGFRGSLASFLKESASRAFSRNSSTLEACDSWGSGAFLLETVPSVIYILMKHGHDPEEAIVRAVNDTRDNDTVAAIVGAAVGALHGKKGIPRRWIDGHLGRTKGSDDGEIGRILDSLKAKIA